MDQDLPAKLEVKQPVISSSFRSRAVPMFSVWLRDLIISLSISAFIIIFLYQPVKVEGTSMMPSLDDQERIFVNKFVYRMEPIRRGDIVVFHYPRDPSKSFIKRVIGLAGDHIRIDAGQVFVNGESLEEDYVPSACRMTAATLARFRRSSSMARQCSVTGPWIRWVACDKPFSYYFP